MEETSGPWHNGVDGERQRDLEAREPDVVDGVLTAAEINNHRWGSADKYRFSRYGYQVRGGHKCMIDLTAGWSLVCSCVSEIDGSGSLQRKTKEKVVSDFSTLSKGTSVGAKPKAALRQVLFSQGVSEKTAASEVSTSPSPRTTNLLRRAHVHHSALPPLFSYIPLFLSSGEKSAGSVEARAGDLRRSSQPEVVLEGGEPGNNAGEELDTNGGFPCGTSRSSKTVNHFSSYLCSSHRYEQLNTLFVPSI